MNKLNTYKIEITETLQKQIEVEAESAEEAVLCVEAMYNNEDVVLDSSNIIDTEIHSLTRDSEFCEHKNLKKTGYATMVNNKLKDEFLCYDCGMAVFI